MPEKWKKMTVFAPAKVNLHLLVKDRRQDGFHNIKSIFLAVDWGDTVIFTPLEGENTAEITMEGGAESFSIPIGKNIVFRALSLFREKTGFSQGLKITVEKRIPIGGGLGGGSSNAAAVLLTLNKIAGNPLGLNALLEMGAVLGSDVPFFLHETAAARVTGRGEHIEPIEISRFFLVLVNPGFSSDTAAAFKLLDEYRAKGYEDTGSRRTGNIDTFDFCNDFLPVFKAPEKMAYDKIISSLRESGALFANLSGAGSTCFGVFREKEQALKAAELLRADWEFVQCCCMFKSVN